MIREFVEKTLGRLFATHAHDPDPQKMTWAERRDAAEATEPSGRPMEEEPVDDSDAALSEVRNAMDPGHPMEAPYVDHSEAARVHGRAASEKDGSYLESDLADDDDVARREAVLASPHEPPRSEPAEDNETAREDIERAGRNTGEDGGNAFQRRKSGPV